MPKAKLSFNLPEEQDDFQLACQAHDLQWVVTTLDCELRSHLRYNTHPSWDTTTVEEIRKLLNEMIFDRGVSIE
jgi:hypothetical protein